MGIEASKYPELEELAHGVHPEKVLDQLEKNEQKYS